MLCSTRSLFAAAMVFLGTWIGHVAATAAESPMPNIVVILADDLGYGSLNSYGAPKTLIQTPNCDRLAREGIRLTDANTPSSVCSPTRYGLLTGRYCWRTTLKHEVLGVFSPLHIETTRPTLASMLKKHGYNTAAVGKWHLGYGTEKTDYTRELRPGPLEVGFDYHFGVPSNHGDITGVFVENRQVAGLRSTTLDPSRYGKSFYGGRPFLGLDAPQRVDEDVTATLTKKAVAWLEQQKPETPFFLYFTPVAVHHPVTPSAKTRGSSAAGPYGDWIHELDASVGGLLDALDRTKLTENTLVIFTSDNGGVVVGEDQAQMTEWAAQKAGLRICGDLRGRKHSVFEGGFRVPFLARWPGKIQAGAVSAEMVSLVDMFATVAAIVGEPMPPAAQAAEATAATAAAEDSYNFLPVLLGQKLERPLRDAMVVHSADGNFAIRQGPWKWIEGKYHPGTKPGALKARAAEFRPQLYNLAQDPREQHDVLKEHPDVAQRLAHMLDQYRDQGHSRPITKPWREKP